MADAGAYRAEGQAAAQGLEPAATIGLSKTHIPPSRGEPRVLTFAEGGKLAMLRHKLRGRPNGCGGVRGRCRRLSKASARRIAYRVAELNWRRDKWKPLTVTLTYPPELAPQEGPSIWADLDTFWKRVQRKWPRASCIWALEAQGSGNPHYHLIVFGVPYMGWRWVARNWDEVIGNRVSAELSASTQVARCRGYRGAASYVANYIKKGVKDQVEREWGRRWGMLGKKWLPWSIGRRVLTELQYRAVWAALMSCQEGQGFRSGYSYYSSVTAFVSDRLLRTILSRVLPGP